MIDKNKTYNVKNRSAGACVYTIPELHIRRELMAGQTIQVQGSELEALKYRPGGKEMMLLYLQISDIEDFEVETEPEYKYSEADIIKLIETGTMDEFLDCLDFAPNGVIDLIKTFAVSLPMNDANKRLAVKEKTGFDVDEAIRHINEDKAEEKGDAPAVEAPKTRRTAAKSGRRAAAPKTYEVVDKGE